MKSTHARENQTESQFLGERVKLSILAEHLCAFLQGKDVEVVRATSLQAGRAGSIAPFLEGKFAAKVQASGASAILSTPNLAKLVQNPEQFSWLLVDSNPRESWGALLRLLYPMPSCEPGIHATAVVSPLAQVHPTAFVGPLAVIQAGAVIGEQAQIHAQAFVGEQAHVGARAQILPGAVIFDGVELGEDVVVGARSVLGGCGFGLDSLGRIPHVGRLVVENGVQIGAGCTIDRAPLDETRICAHAMLDNLVHIGHGARVGERAVICGQSGLAGSAVLEAGAVLGGQVGVSNRCVVGAGARVAARSLVTKNLPAGGVYSGDPAEDHRVRLRRLARIKKLLS